MTRDPHIYLHPDEVRCEPSACPGMHKTCARALAPLQAARATLEDFSLAVVGGFCPHYISVTDARKRLNPDKVKEIKPYTKGLA